MDFILGIVRRFGVWIVILAIIGGVGFVFREHLTGSAADLKVGDCIEKPATNADVKDVQHRPCGDPHDFEVFHIFQIPAVEAGGPQTLPTSAQLDGFIANECEPEFDRYSGLQYATAEELGIGTFSPTQRGWNDGDREVSCYLGRVDGTKLTGSMRSAQESTRP